MDNLLGGNEMSMCSKCKIDSIDVNRITKLCKKCHEKFLHDNFHNIKTKHRYIPIVFNKQSNITVNMYVKFFSKNHGTKRWTDVLKYYGAYDEYEESMNEIFKLVYEKTGSKSIRNLSRIVKCSEDIICNIVDFDQTFKKLGLTKHKSKVHNTDLDSDFKTTVDMLGYIPLYSEYFSVCKYGSSTYEKHHVDKNIPMYDLLVKRNSTEQDFYRYMKEKKKRKADNFYNNDIASVNKYTDDQLVLNLKEIFNNHYEAYGVYPARRHFNDVSKICDHTYRKYLINHG